MSASTSVAINGPAIRELRKLLGMSVNLLAEEAEVDASYISNIEAGRRQTIPPHLFRKLVFSLRLQDPRAIIANPYADYRWVVAPEIAVSV